MSHIDELIAELCPGGVPFVSLGELEDQGIIKLGRGKVISKKTLEENPGPYPVYSSSGLGTGEFGRYAEFMFDSEQITWSVDGGGRFFYRTAHKYSVTNVSGWMEVLDNSSIITKYLFHVLDSAWQTKTFDYVHKAHPSVIRVEYSIALPPLEVQRAIVEVLDTFSKLEAELEAELEARKQQYEHYRVSLLTSVESAKWSTLGDISSRVSTGATPKAGKPEYYRDGTIPWLRTGEVTFGEVFDTEIKITNQALKETGTSWIKENCVIVAISGATAARSAINKIPLTTNQHCCNLQIDESLANYRFVFFWVSSKYEELKSLGRGARSDLNTKIIKDFPIPVPSLEEQARIVGILDKFDALVNDLSVGLPAELAARRQQYEYYRDRLLTFKELEPTS